MKKNIFLVVFCLLLSMQAKSQEFISVNCMMPCRFDFDEWKSSDGHLSCIIDFLQFSGTIFSNGVTASGNIVATPHYVGSVQCNGEEHLDLHLEEVNIMVKQDKLNTLAYDFMYFNYGECARFIINSGISVVLSKGSLGMPFSLSCGITSLSISGNFHKNNSGVSLTVNSPSLTSITFEDDFNSFGYLSIVMSDKHNLTSFYVTEGNPYYSSVDGVLFNNDKTTLIQFPQSKTGKYNIPESVKRIGSAAFSYCKNFTVITIPNNVTSIGVYAFSRCKNLTSIVISESVKSIENYAFDYCDNLTSIINLNPEPPSGGTSFGVFNKSVCTLYVPKNSKEAYLNTTLWKGFANIIELPEISEEDITVTPSENNALIELQSYENAEGYKLIIYSDEAHTDTIYIFEFDATGKLFNTIPFRSASTNFSHTVENLQSGTEYYYTLEILGVDNVTLVTLSDKFTTTGTFTSIAETESVSNNVAAYYTITGQRLSQEPQHGIFIIKYDDGTVKKVMR